MAPLVEAGLGLVTEGSWAAGAAAETGVADGEADTEDPDAGVVGEAEATGLGDAKGLGKGLGEGATFFEAVTVGEACGAPPRDDDGSFARGAINDFAFDLLLLVAGLLTLF